MPKPGGGRLLDLPETCRLFWPGVLNDTGSTTAWVDWRAAWNADGLGLSVAVSGKPTPFGGPNRESGRADEVQIWIDTRDTRDAHRATRFCHRFAATLTPGKGKEVEVRVEQRAVARAQADAPRVRMDRVLARGESNHGGRAWLLELYFPAAVLHGYDPETNRRLGLMAHVSDPDRGDLFLGGLGREFPVESDPSLWTTLLLSDETDR